MIKLIASDLDGTLVNEDLEISPRLHSLLHRLQHETDIRFVLATGRMFPSTLPFARRLGITSPVISYQGAMIREIEIEREALTAYPVLFHQGLPVPIAEDILAWVKQEGIHANVYVNDQLFTTHWNPHSKYYQNISGVTPQTVDNLQSILTDSPTKIMLIDENSEAIIQYLQQAYPGTLHVCRSRANYTEIVHADVSKWTAVSFLMQQWGIRPEEVMTIGDHENDLPMIEAAGVGVAMGNAPEHVKAKATFVTRSIEEEGAVYAIETAVFGGGL